MSEEHCRILGSTETEDDGQHQVETKGSIHFLTTAAFVYHIPSIPVATNAQGMRHGQA